MASFVPVRKVAPMEPVAKPAPDFQPTAKVRPGEEIQVNPSAQRVPMAEQILRPTIEGLGLGLGGAGGSLAGPAGTVAGAGLGYAAARRVNQLLFDEPGRPQAPIKEQIANLPGELQQSSQDVARGATMEMGGQVLAGKVFPALVKPAGRLGAQVIGKLTGTGSGAAKEAYKSGARVGPWGNPFKSKTSFDKALRGEIDGEEVVKIARNALSRIKDARAARYQSQLDEIMRGGPARLPTAGGRNLPAKPGQALEGEKIDVSPIGNKLKGLMKQYNIKFSRGPKGEIQIDASRAAMGKKGRNDIEEVIELVGKWGDEPEDFTVKGLDALKRQLNDFYSESSQARGFVNSIENTVKDTITKHIPEYAKMTKDYAKATALIKDIESNLMMRKQGMSGRIVSDQTLKRLMAAMKDNFELRRELVGMLSKEGGEDVMGAVAGHSMRSFVPRGLAGTGPALATNVAMAQLVNPAFWPVVAASSPRVSAEFLRLLGRYTGRMAPLGGALGRVGTLQVGSPKQPTSRKGGQQ